MSVSDRSGKNRRAFMRRPAKSNVKETCRKGALDLGSNLATRVLDVSESGVRLLVKARLDVGLDVSVGLEGLFHMRPVVRTGKIVWSVPMADTGSCIGVLFEKYLAYQDVRLLT